jgi:hypothetical protein
MPEELTELVFSIEDKMAGRPLSPETIDLPTLRGFLEEVETLIKGDVPGASLTDSRVRIESGSVRVVASVAPPLAADVRADLSRLDQTGDLDLMQPKRAQVIEKWLGRARRSTARTYAMEVGTARPLRVTNSSQFQHGSENAWVSVEKHLAGKVVDLGGKHDPNVHLVLSESGESVRVAATERQLGEEKENQLYKQVYLRVHGEQHLRTKALRNLRLIEFLPQASSVDEEALAVLWEKGRKAWEGVPSAAGWVESLRGNQ